MPINIEQRFKLTICVCDFVSCQQGFAGLAVYSGTKFFVEGMSQAMRQELADTGVKVTCIQPGDVRTELLVHTTDLEVLSTVSKDTIEKGTVNQFVFRVYCSFYFSLCLYNALHAILICLKKQFFCIRGIS